MSNGNKLNQMHYFVKVLVVDDIFYVKKTISRILTEAGFFVLSAASSKEAIEKYSKYSPDLITVSHKLADMPGQRFVMNFKELYKDSNVKLLFISNRSEMDKVELLLSDYIDSFISKPIIKEELISVIKKLFPPKL